MIACTTANFKQTFDPIAIFNIYGISENIKRKEIYLRYKGVFSLIIIFFYELLIL